MTIHRTISEGDSLGNDVDYSNYGTVKMRQFFLDHKRMSNRDQRISASDSHLHELRPALQPSVSDPKNWWETFWGDQPDRFGAPSEEVLGLIDRHSENATERRAIDVGSGNGRYAFELSSRGYATTALEWTRTGANLIREEGSNLGKPVRVIQEDCLAASYGSETFDLVFSSGLLEELAPDEQAQALSNICGIANPGSPIVIKFCEEISGRGKLVDAAHVMEYLSQSGVEIASFKVDPRIRFSKSDMFIKAATLVGFVR